MDRRGHSLIALPANADQNQTIFRHPVIAIPVLTVTGQVSCDGSLFLCQKGQLPVKVHGQLSPGTGVCAGIAVLQPPEAVLVLFVHGDYRISGFSHTCGSHAVSQERCKPSVGDSFHFQRQGSHAARQFIRSGRGAALLRRLQHQIQQSKDAQDHHSRQQRTPTQQQRKPHAHPLADYQPDHEGRKQHRKHQARQNQHAAQPGPIEHTAQITGSAASFQKETTVLQQQKQLTIGSHRPIHHTIQVIITLFQLDHRLKPVRRCKVCIKHLKAGAIQRVDTSANLSQVGYDLIFTVICVPCLVEHQFPAICQYRPTVSQYTGSLRFSAGECFRLQQAGTILQSCKHRSHSGLQQNDRDDPVCSGERSDLNAGHLFGNAAANGLSFQHQRGFSFLHMIEFQCGLIQIIKPKKTAVRSVRITDSSPPICRQVTHVQFDLVRPLPGGIAPDQKQRSLLHTQHGEFSAAAGADHQIVSPSDPMGQHADTFLDQWAAKHTGETGQQRHQYQVYTDLLQGPHSPSPLFLCFQLHLMCFHRFEKNRLITFFSCAAA